MIRINMNTARLKLTVEGHAMQEEGPEYQQICAAASALAQSLAWSVNKYNEGEGTMKSFEYRPETGNLLIRVWPEHWAEAVFKRKFKDYADGFELLAKSHPQSVEFIWDGERILPEKEETENE